MTAHPFPNPRAHPQSLKTGEHSLAGGLVGGFLHAVTDLFSRNTRARAAAAHDKPRRAPTGQDHTPTFDCPNWPECGCPGGTVRPECPGLKERRGRDGQWMIPVFAVALVIWLVLGIVLALAILP